MYLMKHARTISQNLEICKLVVAGCYSYTDIASIYGIGQQTVW